jgi:hypothetical protein
MDVRVRRFSIDPTDVDVQGFQGVRWDNAQQREACESDALQENTSSTSNSVQ